MSNIIDTFFDPHASRRKQKKGFLEIVRRGLRTHSGSPISFPRFSINKRQKFIISILILSSILFFSEYIIGKPGVIFISLILAMLTEIFFFISIYADIKENLVASQFILPFLFSFSSGMFYFLWPPRLFVHIGITILYALGLYSLFLSQNIFVVSSIRTIALLSSARIVSFVVTLLSNLFLSTIIFSLHLPLAVTLLFLFGSSFLLILHSLWTFSLQTSLKYNSLWAAVLSYCLTELALILWFWPTVPIAIAILLTGFFYFSVGLSHVWMDKRLFKGILWEYSWALVFTCFLFMIFTYWTG